jgi:imidazolonepropionase
MGCTLFRVRPLVQVRGFTVKAARALGLHDRGLLRAGARADFCVWDVQDANELAYWFGYNPLKRRIVGAAERP